MVRRTREEAEQTRQQLLDAALTLYAEKGLSHVSLKAISAHCGVTHGALYWHFKNRDDLLQQLYFSQPLPFESQYIEQRQAARQDPLLALQAYLLGVVRQFAANPRCQQAFRIFAVGREQPELVELQAQIDADRQVFAEHVRFFLKQAKKKKQLRKKLSVKLTAENLQLLLESLLQLIASREGSDVALPQAEQMWEMLFNGIKA